MIYVNSLRKNDLDKSKGKQIEFNKRVAREFFCFRGDEAKVKFTCCSINDTINTKEIDVFLKLSPKRGDYKIYQNEDGSDDLKDYLLIFLHLSAELNVGDYFAILKHDDIYYDFCYIPKDTLFKAFAKWKDRCFIYSDLNVNRNSVELDSLQVIFYGAPGTGKSHHIKALEGKGVNPIRTTFHPDSDYSTFVGAYKPTMEMVERYESSGNSIKEKRIVYEYVPQAFIKAYVGAWSKYPEPQYLVIEEINRGNCAQIFGDLFQLLDRNDGGFSEYPIFADTDIQKYLVEAFEIVEIPIEVSKYYNKEYNEIIPMIKSGQLLVLPNNLYILGTMNTSDQSLFPIDSAFKRRWDWVYLPIKDENMEWIIEADGRSWNWWLFLEKINARIESITDSEDKKLGYFFAKPKSGKVISADRFVSKVVFYLWNDVFKNYGFDDDIFVTSDGQVLKFSMFFDARYNGMKVDEKIVASFIEKVTKSHGVSISGGKPETMGDHKVENSAIAEEQSEK